MKTIITGITLLAATLTANAQSNDNVFQNSEDEIYYQTQTDPGTEGGIGGTDPEEAPIDTYIPLIAIAGGVLVFYTVRKKKNTAH